MILVVDGIQVVVWPVSGRLPDGRIARRGRHESIRPGSASLWPCKPFALVNGVEVHPVPGARRRFPRDDGCGRRDESRVARPGAFHLYSLARARRSVHRGHQLKEIERAPRSSRPKQANHWCPDRRRSTRFPGDAPGSAVVMFWMARSQVSPDLSAATQGRRRSPSRNPPRQCRQRRHRHPWSQRQRAQGGHSRTSSL